MKLIIYYALTIVVVIILIPLIIVKGCGGVKKEILDEKKGYRVNVYFHKSKEIKEVAFEDYIRGVVAAEMPASYGIEALKAQAVAARTYAFNKINSEDIRKEEHPEAEICTNPAHCQAWVSKEEAFNKWAASERGFYWDKISWAVKSTTGEMVFFGGKLANPLFHANSGGTTENAEDVWGGKPVPYLKSIESPGEENSSSYLSQAEFTVNQLTEKIKKEYSDFKINQEKLSESVSIKGHTRSGRVKEMVIGNKLLKGTEVRELLNLKSTNFSVRVSKNVLLFDVKGYGHGVGMSQCGANALAQKGKNYREILQYYYQGVEIR